MCNDRIINMTDEEQELIMSIFDKTYNKRKREKEKKLNKFKKTINVMCDKIVLEMNTKIDGIKI